LLVGCTTQEIEQNTDMQPKQNIFVEIPFLNPRLYVSFIAKDLSVQQVQATQLGASWSHCCGGYCADSPHVLQLRLEDIIAITLNLDNESIEFEIQFSDDYPPDSVIIRRWKAEYARGRQDISDVLDKYELIEAKDNIIHVVNDGNDYVYEVYATWAEGFSFYGFRTESME